MANKIIQLSIGNDNVYPKTWDTEYHKGDTASISGVYPGFLQNNNGLQVYFTIPLPKPVGSDVTSVKLTGTMTVRSGAGGNSGISLSNYEKERITASGVTFSYKPISVGQAATAASVWIGGGGTLTFS